MAVEQLIAGKFRVLRRLGSGGMSTVYLAENVRLGAQVALKVLRPEGSTDAATVKRFEREARIACQLKGPHCVRVYDVEVGASGELVLVMEHLEGRDLQAVLDGGDDVPLAQAVDWVLQVCSAMDEAHALGIVHRDLKPSNLFVTAPSGAVKVLDFGLSKQLGQQQITQGNELLGTPSYMAPEQLEAKAITSRADVWSLCVVLYRLLAGRLPWQAGPNDGTWELANRLAAGVAEPLTGLPAELAAVVMKGLERDVGKRLASVAELARGIAKFGSGKVAFQPFAAGPALGEGLDEPTLPATPADAMRRRRVIKKR